MEKKKRKEEGGEIGIQKMSNKIVAKNVLRRGDVSYGRHKEVEECENKRRVWERRGGVFWNFEKIVE